MGKSIEFRIFLVPGLKRNTVASVRSDMHKVRTRAPGYSGVVFNTERESFAHRLAVRVGLGKGWTRVFNNENTMAYGRNWSKVGKRVLLLAKEDPYKAHVSPSRRLNTLLVENDRLSLVTFAMKGTHLLSEANCKHVHVNGRAWREKMWPVQVHDMLEDVERDHKAGRPVVLALDANTGIHFTGKQLFNLFRQRFGSYAVHVHNGGLDQIILVSTSRVRLSEVGKDVQTNNASDHDMVSATVRAVVV